MKPLLRFSVSLSAVLLFSALLKISQAECDTCNSSETEILTTTTTTANISFESVPNCSLSIDNKTSEDSLLTDLTPGTVYQVFISCLNCCKEVTTKPEAVKNLTVTEITTSSVSLNWTEPEGKSSFYRVQWTAGNENTNETFKNITGLTAGVKYNITVTAVADDRKTEGKEVSVSQYTKPEAVNNLTVTEITTSSVSLNWTEPEGKSSFYRVQWTAGNVTKNESVPQTYINVTQLTAGVQYEFTVTAVAGDNKTEGQETTVTRYTEHEAVKNLTVTEITTSSVSLNWTEPEGKSSFYRVQWTAGNVTKNESVPQTYINVTQLTAGVQYEFTVTAVAGDNKTEGQETTVTRYTEPEAVKNLTVTEITTSSVSLNWTEPEGKSSFYRVQWTAGNVTKNESVPQTHINVTQLTAGVQYEFTVTAVAGDNKTEGQETTVTRYTEHEAVKNLTVTEITKSSVSLNWTEPEGKSSFYRVQWTAGNVTKNESVPQTYINVTQLTAGVQYEFTVTAVAGDNKTEGQETTVTRYTEPEAVKNLTVTEITTSSVSLNWTEPEGKSSFYRVQWTAGNVTKNESVPQTYINVTQLTAGVQYEFTVTAVAGDNKTEGQETTVTRYTVPGKIVEINVLTTTSTISIDWSPPPGHVFRYRVEWNNGGAQMVKYTSNASTVLSSLIPGTTYAITLSAVAGDNKTGEPYKFTSHTKPAQVRNLAVTNVTTSSVSLTWTKPEGNATSYVVRWTAVGDAFNNTISETSITIKNLTPGRQYNITVAAVAVISSNEGERTLKTTFTWPEKPQNIVNTAKGTNDLKINWTLPNGVVDHYVVNISNEDLTYFKSSVTTVSTADFTDLRPGRIFVITVTAVAGNFFVTSDQSSFATYPTPPGSINISQRTNSSLHLNWATPSLMEGAPHISYHITYQPEDGEVLNKNTTINNTELSLLSSGTFYNITLQTVGPQDLRSTVVRNSAFTLPNPVLNLVASPKSTTSVEVKWSYPQGAREYYKYLVQTYNSTGAVVSITTINNSTDVTNLEPGTGYSINVTTIAEGSESTEERTFSYTMPKAVTNLTVEDVNTTAIRLTWLRQSDYKSSYSYLVIALKDGIVVQNVSAETETYAFLHLKPGVFYTFNVITVVEGVKSSVATTSSFTKPEGVSDIIVVGSTNSLSVSWSPVSGQVIYTVLLYRDGQLVGNKSNLNNATVNTLFLNQKPGVLYCVKVVTKSGPFEISSSSVCNATFPNPPGTINVSQTVNSINFTWSPPENMESHQYNFSVSTFKGSFLTENNWFLLENLQSGTLYNISVVTVGLRNYESTAVTAENYTRPHSVTELRQVEITTDAVTLVWNQPETKPHYSYVVQASNGSVFLSEEVFNTTDTITGLLSGSNYSFTVTTQTAHGTQAAPRTVSYFTRPYNVRRLEAETLNTTAVHLFWTEPQEYKPEYTYQIETTGCAVQNKNLTGNSTQISELSPGTKCNFRVLVRAADGIEGKASSISQYTKPETVQPSISSQGSNSSILVSWIKPPGNVERYVVHLNSTSTLSTPQEQILNFTGTSRLFESLSAGRLYSAMVTTSSGPFNASSGFVTNATFPNPPGPIEILRKTTNSIDIRWKEAPLMAGASFHYRLTNTSPREGQNIDATNTNHAFGSLLSGTSYNISVATVGVMGFESEKVQIYMVTTRPFSVKDLSVSTKEENITLTWVEPDEYKESYRYNVSWQSSSLIITEKNGYTIHPLDPGTLYNISVTTETSDGTQGAPRWIFSCTNASPVKKLKCNGPNKRNAEVQLSWTCPNGQYSGFQITVKDSRTINTTNTYCNHTVPDLRHNTEYQLTVTTWSCGQPSTPVTLGCWTGITDPPIPEGFKPLVVVTTTEYTKFSIQINSSLLNNTNGPIKYVGVLVTNNAPDDTSDFTKYLDKTYDQWREAKTTVYLATVKDIHQSRSTESYLNIEVGDETKWEGYTNGALEAGGKYQFAIVLFTNLTLQTDVVNVRASLVSTTPFSDDVELPKNQFVAGIAIGATLGIFCVLFIILIGFIIYWKRISNKETSDIQIHSIRAKVSIAVTVEDYEAYYRKQKADSNCGFAEEFEDLKLVGTAQSKTNALTMENKPKNRYNNVLPYDCSRVKLSIIHGSPYDDYINANYMPGYNSRKEFIAAQGPLPTTVSEFWRMIWEKNVQTLVMLTRCNEQGRVKCEQYWDFGTKHFENITVTTTSEIPLEDWTIREFDIKNVKTAETRSVRHFHFTAWPDHGVPETTELLISFRHLVREHMDQYSRHSPTVVHCSAGVGRTGTFIAIDRLIFQIERENIVDVYGIVHDLRMHRPLMVQTEDQYVFLNQCAMDIIRSRTGTNVDLIYQNTAALSIYENVEPKKGFPKNGYHNA